MVEKDIDFIMGKKKLNICEVIQERILKSKIYLNIFEYSEFNAKPFIDSLNIKDNSQLHIFHHDLFLLLLHSL